MTNKGKMFELLTPAVRPAGEFWGIEDVNIYCDRFARHFYAIAIDLDIAEAVMRTMIAQIPAGPRGTISRARARIVTRHLGKSADACYDAAANMDKIMPALRKAIAKRQERNHQVPKRWTP